MAVARFALRHRFHISRLAAGVAIVLGTAVIAVLANGVFGANGALDDSGSRQQPGLPAPAGKTVTFSPRDARNAASSAGTNVIARARGARLTVFSEPGGKRVQRTLRERRLEGHALPIVTLVVKRRPGWLNVLLPTRPNLSRGWVRRRDVRLAATRYRIEVRLRRHELILTNGSQTVLRRPIAVGKALSPTPTGTYYVTDLLRPPDPKGFYGPYALGLSAHSPVYTSFAGGDGQVGIHGTNDPSVLGTDVSHGCIRVGNRTITRLARTVPLGTPVIIER